MSASVNQVHIKTARVQTMTPLLFSLYLSAMQNNKPIDKIFDLMTKRPSMPFTCTSFNSKTNCFIHVGSIMRQEAQTSVTYKLMLLFR